MAENGQKISISNIGALVALIVSLGTFVFTAGVQAQKIETLEKEAEITRQILMDIPAIHNELVNIGKRLDEIVLQLRKE